MKIVILDGKACNPGDLSWSPIEKLCDQLKIYQTTVDNQIIDRANTADIILVNKVKITKEVLNQLPHLKYIGVTATGFDNIDIESAKKSGVAVTNVPGYSTHSVAQLVFALILELVNQVAKHDQDAHSGGWQKAGIYSYWLNPIHDLCGKVLGIIGMGEIGSQVANIAQSFGMSIIYYSRHNKNIKTAQYCENIEMVFSKADFISLHCPLTAETNQLVNQQKIDLMKPNAYLINTSRGGLIQEDDLSKALNIQQIAGAALDVLSVEPPNDNNPLLSAKNCIITPHVGWASVESRARLILLLAKNIQAYQTQAILNRIV